MKNSVGGLLWQALDTFAIAEGQTLKASEMKVDASRWNLMIATAKRI